MNYLKNKTILITGGTGSFGSFALIELLKIKQIKKIIIFSRDELKQVQMQERLSPEQNKRIRFFIGDVRDIQRLEMACENVDIIIHAAALKHVPVAEYNPIECVKTNIIGSQNVIEVAIKKNVKDIVALSTDKACSPINLYGASKLCMEKIFVAANALIGNKKIKFSVVRYGNVLNSRGSVLPIFLRTAKKNFFNITNSSMSRFNISLNEAFNLVMWSLQNHLGGEIFVPKLKSFKIIDLAKAINNKAKIKITGIREGEKIFEELISDNEINSTYDLKKYYAILSNDILKKYKRIKKLKKIDLKKSYNSKDNTKFLSARDLSKLIKNLK